MADVAVAITKLRIGDLVEVDRRRYDVVSDKARGVALEPAITIVADELDRRHGTSPATQEEIEREASCVICREAEPHDVIAQSEHCWVTAAPAAPMPGYVCVVSKTHVTEPFELPPEQQAAFWLDVCPVARAVRDALTATKVNYEIHGNTVSHLHLHVYPRYAGDPFTGRPIDGSSTAFHRARPELARLARAAEQALRR